MKTKYDNVFINPSAGEVDPSLIAFDLDSVMNEGCSRAIRNAMCNYWGITEDEIVDTHPRDGYRIFHMSPPDHIDYSGNELYNLVAEAVIEDSPSFLHTPWMTEVMRYVYESTGCPIQVVTARRPECVDVTHDWLAEHLGDIPFRAYIQSGQAKSVTLTRMRNMIFVDDRHKTVAGLLEHIPYPVLYQRPWNANRPVKLPVVEVRDLRDIIPLLNITLGKVPMEWPSYVPFPKPREENYVKVR